MKSRLALTVTALLLAAGCLNGDKSISIHYDAAKDQFSLLVVFQRIRSNDNSSSRQGNQPSPPTQDIQHLSALYANRDHLILSVGLPFELFSEPAILRLSNHLACSVNLGSASDGKAFQTSVPLDQIQIVPGEFFLRGQGNLCYAHEIIVPGSVLDAVLAEQSPQLNDALFGDLAKKMRGELDLRRQGQPRVGWDQFTPECITRTMDSMDQSAQPQPAQQPEQANQPPEPDLRIPLETESIRSFLAAFDGHTLKLQRQGSRFFERVDLTPADVESAVAFYAFFRQAVETKAAELAKDHLNLAGQRDVNLFSATNVDPAGPGTLEISTDIVRLQDVFPHPIDAVDAPDADCQRTAKEVEKSLGINKTLTIQQIQRGFDAGKLSAHPPQPPVWPGSGLGIIQMPAQ
jgi:hypothetical protein